MLGALAACSGSGPTPGPTGGPVATNTGDGTGTGTGTGTSGGDGTVEQSCVDDINHYRATLGLPPYARWSSAESCADGQAKSDSESGTAHGAFTKCGEWAQNECPGWPGPPSKMIGDCLKMMWAEGPGGGHYENMRSSKYTQVACGFTTLADGSVWAVQDFK